MSNTDLAGVRTFRDGLGQNIEEPSGLHDPSPSRLCLRRLEHTLRCFRLEGVNFADCQLLDFRRCMGHDSGVAYVALSYVAHSLARPHALGYTRGQNR